jgi:radical SAM superfamily enzyme
MKDFRIKMVTKDGCLVQNRTGKRDFWLRSDGKLDEQFAHISLTADAREKGVRVLSYTYDQEGVQAVVEWL